jgi:hypothetical protein
MGEAGSNDKAKTIMVILATRYIKVIIPVSQI